MYTYVKKKNEYKRGRKLARPMRILVMLCRLGQCKDYHTMEIYLAADVLGLLALELRRSLAWRSKWRW